MRHQPTVAERALWRELRGEQLGQKFRRQHPIGTYIVDFYAPDSKLVIELEGDVYLDPDQVEYDRSRFAYLEASGYRILRYSNRDVLQSIDAVLGEITAALTPLSPHAVTPLSPPAKAGGDQRETSDS